MIFSATNAYACIYWGNKEKLWVAEAPRFQEHQEQKKTSWFKEGAQYVLQWYWDCRNENHSWRHGCPFAIISSEYVFKIMNVNTICIQSCMWHLGLQIPISVLNSTNNLYKLTSWKLFSLILLLLLLRNWGQWTFQEEKVAQSHNSASTEHFQPISAAHEESILT